MLHIPYCEFYLTHTCNLSCQDCHTFNNLPISGHSVWNQVKPLYQAWSEILDIDRISLIGGEPLLNPNFEEWLIGVSNLWPQSAIKIYTNGSQFHRWPNLYQQVCQINHNRSHGKIWFVISIHDLEHRALFNTWLKLNQVSADIWYPAGAKSLEQPLDDVGDILSSRSFTIQDTNGTIIQLRDQEVFHKNALIPNPTSGNILLHNSDPDKAIDICRVKTCHHMRDGLLYKCGPVAVLPKIVKEFDVALDNDDLDLLNSYHPASPTWSLPSLEKFVSELNSVDTIPQCKFCPDTFSYSPVNATAKKIMWQKYNKKDKPGVDKV